jgi:putative hydrolase of the HAD superfamily
MAERPGAVLFDLFETLMTEMAAATDGPPAWGVAGRHLGIADDEFRRAWSGLKARRMTSELSFVDALVEVCESAGVTPAMDEIHRLHDLRQSSRTAAFRAVPAEIVSMLDRLRDAGLPVVVVSNCSVEESVHLADSPLVDRVDAVIWSFEAGVQKPDREIYELGCATAGVAPGDAVFVGDGSFDELRGAVDAGLEAVWASWFTRRWPAPLAERRRSEVEALGVPEAASPAELVARLVP